MATLPFTLRIMWLFNIESLQEVLSKNSCFKMIIDSTSLVFVQMKPSIRTEKRNKPNECNLERDCFKSTQKSTGLFPTIIQNKSPCARLNKNKKLPLMLQRLGGGSGQNSSKRDIGHKIASVWFRRHKYAEQVWLLRSAFHWKVWDDELNKPGWLDFTRNQQT